MRRLVGGSDPARNALLLVPNWHLSIACVVLYVMMPLLREWSWDSGADPSSTRAAIPVPTLPRSVRPIHAWGAVYKSGEVCISILHDPGEDKYGSEDACERWNPIHTVTTIMLSVISMLADPNDMSPANVDAAVSPEILTCFNVRLDEAAVDCSLRSGGGDGGGLGG